MDVEGEEKPKPAVPVSVGEREAPADMEKTSDDNESAGIYRGLYRGRAQQDAGRQEKQERPAYAATVLLGAVVCVLGVTAYLNHEKMVDMEQTLAQMKGTRYVTEAQTADAETEETERMPSVEVETVMGNVEKQELSAEAAGTQEDVTAQQAETAQGAQGTAEPAENATANAAAGTAAGSETAGDTAAAGGQACADAAGTPVEAQTQSTASTDGSLAAQTQGTTTAARELIGGECAGGSSADRGADVSVTGILRCAEGRQSCGNLPENISDDGNAGQALRGQRH